MNGCTIRFRGFKGSSEFIKTAESNFFLPFFMKKRFLEIIMEKQSKDNPDEIFDVVDENDRVIGRAPRAQCHRNPNLIHRSIHVLVFNKKHELFLQKRAQTKDVCPGMWAMSVSGHVDPGESYAAAAGRETKEEIGVSLVVTYLDTCFLTSENEREITAIFTAEAEGPFQLNPREIETGGFFSLAEIKNRLWDDIAPPSRTVLERVMKKGVD